MVEQNPPQPATTRYFPKGDSMDIDQQARHAAARVDSSKVSFDPITIITIFSTVMPLLMQCFNRNDEADPQAVRAAVRGQHERAPKALLKRTARRIRGEANEPMTKDESFELARAVIDECIEADDETVAAYCSAVAN